MMKTIPGISDISDFETKGYYLLLDKDQ